MEDPIRKINSEKELEQTFKVPDWMLDDMIENDPGDEFYGFDDIYPGERELLDE